VSLYASTRLADGRPLSCNSPIHTHKKKKKKKKKKKYVKDQIFYHKTHQCVHDNIVAVLAVTMPIDSKHRQTRQRHRWRSFEISSLFLFFFHFFLDSLNDANTTLANCGGNATSSHFIAAASPWLSKRSSASAMHTSRAEGSSASFVAKAKIAKYVRSRQSTRFNNFLRGAQCCEVETTNKKKKKKKKKNLT
jgi:hypothetical protein